MVYKVTISSKVPVTVWYDGRNCPPIRQVVYRVPTVKQTHETLQLGYITFNKQRVTVKRKRGNVCDNWGMWEATPMVVPTPLL